MFLFNVLGIRHNDDIKLLSKEDALGALMNNVKYFIQEKGLANQLFT